MSLGNGRKLLTAKFCACAVSAANHHKAVKRIIIDSLILLIIPRIHKYTYFLCTPNKVGFKLYFIAHAEAPSHLGGMAQTRSHYEPYLPV